MKSLQISAILLLALSSSACAMGSDPRNATASLTQDQIQTLASNLGPTHSSHLVQSPDSCAPDAADPVWGPGNQMLGFSCYAAPQGGN
jgi:hypothetical protein